MSLSSIENEPGTESPLYEHLQRSMQYTLDRLGPNNLPLIGRADWNDCLNLNCFSDTPGQSFQTTTNKDGKIAESVFIAGLFVLACNEMIGLAQHYAKINSTTRHRRQHSILLEAAAEMEKTVWAAGWDGEWFRRAYDDFGHVSVRRKTLKARSSSSRRASVSWQGSASRTATHRKALDSVGEHLATPHGIVLQQPAFSQYYLHLGEISSYPPGYKENAGIFCHTNPWIMIAEAVVGTWRQGIRLLQAHQPIGARGDQRTAQM